MVIAVNEKNGRGEIWQWNISIRFHKKECDRLTVHTQEVFGRNWARLFHIGKEQIVEGAVVLEQLEHRLFVDADDTSFIDDSRRRQLHPLRGETLFLKKTAGLQDRDDGDGSGTESGPSPCRPCRLCHRSRNYRRISLGGSLMSSDLG